MSRSDDRERGITLRLIDTDKVSQRALEHLKVSYPEADWVSARPDTEYAVADCGRTVYVIGTEGVGWEVKYGKPFAMDIITSWRNSDGVILNSMTATSEVYLGHAELLNLLSEETIDLADLVRSFGARLENNFWLWHRTLTEEEAKTP